MVQSLSLGKIFHLDATYRILKLAYPVIVFGMSDINRKFFPIAFMITSHETETDYISFFNALKEVSVLENLNLTLNGFYSMHVARQRMQLKKFFRYVIL